MNYEKLTKTQARKLYESGKVVYLHTSLLSWNNAWQNPIPFNTDEVRPTYKEAKFDDLVNSFHYYNCDKERGMRVIFLKLKK